MTSIAATRQAPRADLTSAPKSLDWARYVRDNVKLTASARSLALLLITLGQGQHISLSQSNMAKSIGMRRDTVADAIDELHRLGLLAVKGKGRNRTTIYRLTLPRSRQVVPVEDQLVVPVEDQLVVPVEDHNIEQEDEDADEDNINMRSAQDDDVANAPSGSNRAKASTRSKGTARAKDFPSVEDYISDLEGCVDELARRLDMDPGRINIKVVAKTFRQLGVEYDADVLFSDILDEFPADHPRWQRFASKNNPVGYMLDEFARCLAENADQDEEVPVPDPAQDPALDPASAVDTEEREEAERQAEEAAVKALIAELAKDCDRMVGQYAELTGTAVEDVKASLKGKDMRQLREVILPGMIRETEAASERRAS